MFKIKYILSLVLLLVVKATFAQKNERDYLRSGNRHYRDSSFVRAEIDYRKALELDPKSTEALFNLANAVIHQNSQDQEENQQRFKEAMELYGLAAKMESNKSKLAQIYHNMGVLLQSAQQYAECIEAYKQSLRNNPHDDETRYNLALAQRMLDNQQQDQDQNQDQDQQDQNQDQNQDQQQQDQQDQQQDQQQQQQQQSQPDNQMSKENAEQLLNAAMQDEKQTQERIKQQQQQPQSKQLDKNW